MNAPPTEQTSVFLDPGLGCANPGKGEHSAAGGAPRLKLDLRARQGLNPRHARLAMLTRIFVAAAAALLMSAAPANAEWRAANEAVAAAVREPRIAAALEAVTRIDAATISGDAEAFADALASDLAVNNPQNAISKREDTARLAAQGFISYSRYMRTIEYAGLRGDMVVLMGEERVTASGTNPNAGHEVVRRFTDLWKQENGAWKLTARQASIVSVR